MGAFDQFSRQRNVVVTTYKRDGTAVPTTVNVVVLGDHAYFRTWDTSGKAKRLRRDPHLLIAPSTGRGRPTGPAISGTARLLNSSEEPPVRDALAKKYSILQGRIVPLFHGLRHLTTVHYEVTAEKAGPETTAEAGATGEAGASGEAGATSEASAAD